MARGRVPRGDQPVRWIVWLPGRLAAELELLLYDPILHRPKYGSKSEVVRSALELWLQHQKIGARTHGEEEL